ncbi:MAG TPA: CCA tRNA nucleotidyltransferase [Tepidisphaeraceae bacterium]|jgi:poly(A) polymerase|nr:CCA tRNA nucleotidyltransferase [Tepidisphaeraceae bacterium]
MIPPAESSRLKPLCSRPDAEQVVQRLRDDGYVAYFAGGCVRDLLLGLEAKDFDVATDAPPKRVRQLFSNTQAVGAAFGVILVRLGGSQIEVATFRAEGRYLDGRRPEAVEFTDAQHDALRRDFTINGLFLDPFTNQVIDYVNGQSDLQSRILRAIGNPDERFNEDHLRLLRAVRFAARFDLTIEPDTALAIRRHAPKLIRISPERIADELHTMLTASTRNRAWPKLWEFSLIDLIFRFLLLSTENAEFNPAHSIFLTITPAETLSFGLSLAAASLDYLLCATPDRDIHTLLTPARIQQIGQALRQSLRISNEELDNITSTLSSLLPLLHPDAPPSVATMKRFLAKNIAQGSWALLTGIDQILGTAGRAQWLKTHLDDLSQTDYAPTPLITGDDLTALGLKPSPLFRRILESTYDAQLETRITTRAEALSLATQIASTPS